MEVVRIYYVKKIIKNQEYWYIQKSIRTGKQVTTKYIAYVGTSKPQIAAREYYHQFIKPNKDCPLCKGKKKSIIGAMVEHHIYLFDDGNISQKYPQWTIKICNACNHAIGKLNQLIKDNLNN